MDKDAFIKWALDGSRTVEDRYTIELLVQDGVSHWKSKRKIPNSFDFEAFGARRRERKLNPAYEPHFTEESLIQAVEYLDAIETWRYSDERPLRSLEPLRFLTTLTSISLALHVEPSDISALGALTALRTLQIGYPGSNHWNRACADFSPLAHCTSLVDLSLSFAVHWPDLTGLDALIGLERLTLSGNLLAMPRDATYPKVREATLHCMPLAARSVRDLPRLPACEFLTLDGVERLDGIEEMPRLRNLTLLGHFQSFTPLESLTELTFLTVTPHVELDCEKLPRDITPISRLPKLLSFKIGPPYVMFDMPRDYSPLAEAPALRELTVQGCPPVEMEVAAIQAGLMPWDDLFLAPEPRPLSRLRMIISPGEKMPDDLKEQMDAGPGFIEDLGMRQAEARWVASHLSRVVSSRIGHEDWGTTKSYGTARAVHLNVESFEVIERFPEIIEAAREAMAMLKDPYFIHLMVTLKVRPPEATPAQKELEEQFQNTRNEWEYEQGRKEEADYLERLHQLELKKQQGEEIDPKDFSPAKPGEMPLPPWEEDDEEDEDENPYGEGGTAIKEKADPPPSWFDDDHPLASSYLTAGSLTLKDLWFPAQSRGLAIHLMGRQPDVDIPEEEKETPGKL